MEAIFEAAKMKIGLLEKANWATWKYKIVTALSGLGLLDLVEGRVSKPVLLDPTQTTSEKFKKELQDYNRGNSAALLLITTNLSDGNLQKVMRFTNAREVWLELHRLFTGEWNDRAYHLCLQFFGYKKQHDHDIATHLSKLKTMWFELMQEMKKSDVKGELPEMFPNCKIFISL